MALIKEKIASAAFRRYSEQTLWLLLEKIVRLVLGLGVSLWLMRYLGVESFGKLSYAQSFATLFLPLATFGLTEIITKELLLRRFSEGQILGTAFCLRLLGSLLFMIFALGVAYFYETNEEKFILIFIISFGYFFTFFDVTLYYFQSKVKSAAVMQLQILVFVLMSGLKISFIFFQKSLFFFAAATALETAFNKFVYFFYYYLKKNKETNNNKERHLDAEKKPFFAWQYEPRLGQHFLKLALPLLLSNALMLIYMRTDQIMIEYFLTDADNGNYAAAVRISELWYFVPMSIATAVFPAILQAKKEAPQRYQKRLQQLFDLMAWLGIAVALVLSLTATWLVQLFAGAAYLGAVGSLQIYAWAGVFVSLGTASGKWLYAESLEKIVFFRTLLGALLNVIANFFLIPQGGIEGAAWGSLLSFALAHVVSNAFHPLLRPLFRLQIRAFLLPLRFWGVFREKK